ncbi:N-acetylmuramoyl-L-alanine amidase [Pseudobacillus badius]|uniref:N-acetylmuramoyl-L-alanine amidase n=1 Tax=Bacillus badius TaxID=1455 RepID=UPI0024A0DBF5|nr:N-acetylmuramoyl-L-alanine amidase [Bacillus badius]GLY11434.1 sporulation-specific N-acetylmuramoyl-L-alanine amidase [Bacillus badius]
MTKIAYCAGHGRYTAGKRTPDDEREWVFNDKVVRAMEAELNTYEGIQLLRTDDPTGKTDVPLNTRTNKANKWGADLYVSVHHNANTGGWGTWTGVETFTNLGANPKSERLARCVHPRIVKAMGLRDRGVKKKNLHIVRETKMPAILTEGGYMDSTVDIAKLRSDAHLKAQGVAIAQGIAEYAGLKKKAGAVTKPATVTEGAYRVYTGMFESDKEAEKQAKLIGAKLGYKPFAKEKRVWTGVFNTLESAMTAQQKISREFGFNPQIRKEE